MSSSASFKYVYILLFLLLAIKIESQRIRFPLSDDRLQNSPDCNCVPITNCSSLRNQKDWRTSGETCGYRNRRYRMVCCPSSVILPPVDTIPLSANRVPPTVDTITPPSVDISPLPVETVPHLVNTLTPPPVDIDRSATPKAETGVCGLSYYGEDPFKPLIVGGENARDGQWPWMAAIQMRESTGDYAPLCSGFLIDNRHVISAAHCYRTRDDDLYRARIGSINQNEGDEYRIIRIAIPDGYTNGQFYDDIAILTLDRDVNFPNFNPVCLPNDDISKMRLIGRGLTIAGWGADRLGGEQKVLLQYLARLPVVSNTGCQRTLRRTLRNSYLRQFPRGISKDFICTAFKEADKSACGGDSGGPQMIQNGNRWYAVGIISFGVRCGVPGMPAGSTRVASYIDWIRDNTRD